MTAKRPVEPPSPRFRRRRPRAAAADDLETWSRLGKRLGEVVAEGLNLCPDGGLPKESQRAAVLSAFEKAVRNDLPPALADRFLDALLTHMVFDGVRVPPRRGRKGTLWA